MFKSKKKEKTEKINSVKNSINNVGLKGVTQRMTEKISNGVKIAIFDFDSPPCSPLG